MVGSVPVHGGRYCSFCVDGVDVDNVVLGDGGVELGQGWGLGLGLQCCRCKYLGLLLIR